MHAEHACISLWGACISLWCHRLMHGLTAWDLKFQVCLGYTFTPATLWPANKQPMYLSRLRSQYTYRAWPSLTFFVMPRRWCKCSLRKKFHNDDCSRKKNLQEPPSEISVWKRRFFTIIKLSQRCWQFLREAWNADKDNYFFETFEKTQSRKNETKTRPKTQLKNKEKKVLHLVMQFLSEYLSVLKKSQWFWKYFNNVGSKSVGK
jgi:hypothetical protein